MDRINFADWAIKLSRGAHDSPKKGMCVMEAVSYIAGEQWSDRPKCACPAVAAFARVFNDCLSPKDRQRLIPYVLRLAGSKGSREVLEQRGFMAADFAVRIALPVALEARKLPELAAQARAIAPVTDRQSARSARDATVEIRRKAADADAAAAAARRMRASLVNEGFALLDRMLALTEPAQETPAVIARAAELPKVAA